MTRIFVSSTFKDLEKCREEVRLVLRQMRLEDVAMEYFVAEDKRPVDKCLEDVASSDLYIGIFAWRYGYIPPEHEKSITELEYRKAVETGKKCLIFLLHENAPWLPKFVDKDDSASKIEALRNELSTKYTVSFFDTPQKLAREVSAAVHNWMAQSGISSAKKELTSELDIEAYTRAIEKKYSMLDLDTLTPSQKDDYIRIQLGNVYVEQNVRENPPPIELPKEVCKKIEGEWGLDKECLLPEGLDPEHIKKKIESYYSKTPILVLDVITAEPNKYLVILGDPGSGKSTLAKYITLSILGLNPDEKLEKKFAGYLPLLIELRDFVGLCSENKCDNFLDYFHYLGDTQGLHLKGDEIDRYLKDNGKALVIFDGLDEIFDPVMWERVNRIIAGFTLDYPKARIIVTSRSIGYDRKILLDSDFSHFTIQEFEKDHIINFLDKWYSIALGDNEERMVERKERIMRSLKESASIRQLAGNPLLLTILAIIAKHQEIPQERWKLFNHAAGVLVEHWDINRHLKDNRIDADFIREDDKKELLRRIAFKMQSGPDGLAGNYIGKQVLQQEIEEYLKERFSLTLDRANVIARSIIEQFRTRNFVLCMYGPDFFGFIHRTFLEYFCADAIVEKFNDQEIDIEVLKKDFFGKYWENKTWHEVLRLMCGMKEKRAGDLIEHLMQVYDPQWFGNRPPWNIVLATKCLSEVRNPDAIDDTAKKLLLRVTKLFDMVRWTQDINKFLGEEVVPAVKLVGTNWPHSNLIIDWVSKTYAYKFNFPLLLLTPEVDVLFDLDLTSALAEFAIDVGSSYDELYQIFMNKLSSDKKSRLLALLALAKGWHDNPEILPLLKERAVDDEDTIIRTVALLALAKGWHDNPEILPLLKERAVDDEDTIIRMVALLALAQGWHDDPEILPLLKERAVDDEDPVVRMAAIQAIVKSWHNDPEILPLLKGWIAQDEDNVVRMMALLALAQGWHDDPDTLPLLKEQAAQDEDNGVRTAAIQAIAQGWHDDPDILPLLKGWVAQGENNVVRMTAIQAIVQGWHDDPDTLPLLKEQAVDDEDPVVRMTAIQAIVQGWHDDPDTLPLLKEQAVDDEDPVVMTTAIQAIAQGWHDDPEILPLLKGWVAQDEDNDVRTAAIQAIAQGWHDDPDTLPLLKEQAAQDEDNGVRTAAIQAIVQGWHNDPDTLPLLKERAVEDKHEGVRTAAVEALAEGWHDDRDILHILEDMAENDENEDVRIITAQAMLHYGIK